MQPSMRRREGARCSFVLLWQCQRGEEVGLWILVPPSWHVCKHATRRSLHHFVSHHLQSAVLRRSVCQPAATLHWLLVSAGTCTQRPKGMAAGPKRAGSRQERGTQRNASLQRNALAVLAPNFRCVGPCPSAVSLCWLDRLCEPLARQACERNVGICHVCQTKRQSSAKQRGNRLRARLEPSQLVWGGSRKEEFRVRQTTETSLKA